MQKINVDLTTVFSAEAALGLSTYEDPKNAWFIYSLGVLTQALLDFDAISVHKPPTSKENNTQPPGKIISFLSEANLPMQFYEPYLLHKGLNVYLANEWLNEHRELFTEIYANKNFWNQIELLEWLKWHIKNEWPNRWERFNGKIVGPEFENFINSFDLRNDEEYFVFDVLTRGYYYRIVTEGESWLHPIRVLNLPTSPDNSDTSLKSEFIENDLFLIILVALQENTINKSEEERISFWTKSIYETKKFYTRPFNLEEIKNDMAHTWKISNWEEKVYKLEKFWKNDVLVNIDLIPTIIKRTIEELTTPIIEQAKLEAFGADQSAVDRALKRGRQRILQISNKLNKS
jgi:hypothetical protein